MEIDKENAREILKLNYIELSPDDPRTPEQYVLELLVYIEAETIKKIDERHLNNERYKSSQSTTPYFA